MILDIAVFVDVNWDSDSQTFNDTHTHISRRTQTIEYTMAILANRFAIERYNEWQ